LFRKLLLTLAAAFALTVPAFAEDDPQLAKIANMPAGELDVFMSGIASAVNQDTLKLRNFAQTNDCLDLVRAANSFALGYTYLGAGRDAAKKLDGKDGPRLQVKAIQIRVTTFAARVRAEEWLTRRCRDYTPPAEYADDPRYAVPARVTNPEYTEAVVEARQVAETNLAIAVNAGISGKCPEVVAARQNISLLLPYIQKLLTDTARRPQVLGPRASRRGLEVSRRQLEAALDKLQTEFSQKCQSAKTQAAPAPSERQPAEREPAQ